MTTQINVTVGGVELPAQARRGQEGNRWRLEQTEQQRQTTAQQQAAQAQQAAKAVTGTPSGRGPGYSYRPDELAAFRHGGGAFVVILNLWRSEDPSTLELFVSIPKERKLIPQAGSIVLPAMYSEDDAANRGISEPYDRPYPVAYVYTERNLSVSQFLATRAGVAISNWLQTQVCWPIYVLNTAVQWRGAYKLNTGQSVTAATAGTTSYRAALRFTVNPEGLNMRMLTGVTSEQDFSVDNGVFVGVSEEFGDQYVQAGYPPIDASGNYNESLYQPFREKWIDPDRLGRDWFDYSSSAPCRFGA